MSADNYLYVRKWRGRYYLDQGCASVNPPSGKPVGAGFDSLDLVLRAAILESDEGYYEYGLNFSPAVIKEIKERAPA